MFWRYIDDDYADGDVDDDDVDDVDYYYFRMKESKKKKKKSEKKRFKDLFPSSGIYFDCLSKYNMIVKRAHTES